LADELLKKKRSEIIEEARKMNPKCPPCLVDVPAKASAAACQQLGTGDKTACENVLRRFQNDEISYKEAKEEFKRAAGDSDMAKDVIDRADEFLEDEVVRLRTKGGRAFDEEDEPPVEREEPEAEMDEPRRKYVEAKTRTDGELRSLMEKRAELDRRERTRRLEDARARLEPAKPPTPPTPVQIEKLAEFGAQVGEMVADEVEKALPKKDDKRAEEVVA